MKKVLVIGGGAAGMFAAISAAEEGHEVHLFEKNEKCGKKLYITGKGRCNLTNACEMEELFNNVCSNGKFLYSSFYGFTNQDAIAFFEENGTKTKVERGERVFPLSDHSSDVIGALTRKMRALGVQVHLNIEAKEILTEEKVKQRWQQMEEMDEIFHQNDAWTQGYLRGCMVTVVAMADQEKRAGEKGWESAEMPGNRCAMCENGFHSAFQLSTRRKHCKMVLHIKLVD